MNATYAYGKYDSDDNLIVGNIYSDEALTDISEVEALRQYENFMKLADAFGVKGKTTLFRLEPIQTLVN